MGLIGFRLNLARIGSTVDVTLHFSESLGDALRWYKYMPMTGWTDYASHVIFSGDRRSVTLSLQDGGFGDADGIANGVIVDPSGPGAGAASSVSGSSTIGGGGGGGGCFIASASGTAPRARCNVFPGEHPGLRAIFTAFIESLKPQSEEAR
jgi:hypothetical protein